MDDWHKMAGIPISMNEVWRDGLPIWIMSLGATFSGISVYLLLRTEIASRRWGALRSAGLRDSVYWGSWFVSFAVCGIINSLIGAIITVFMPVHVFQHVNFGVVFALLLFLNFALVAASFVLAAACGTMQSTTLTVMVIIGMICAGASPAIGIYSSKGYFDVDTATSTYGHAWGDGGSFWVYSSTERTRVQYSNYTWNSTTSQYDYGEAALDQCELPLVSAEQGTFMKTAEQRDEVPLDDIFTGCFVIPGAASYFTRDKGPYFFWFWLPQVHFTMAWSNILGFTGLPGDTFSLAQASKSPEQLANEALSGYLTREGISQAIPTDKPSLFSEGSTVLPTNYYFYDSWIYVGPPLNNCPSTNIIENMCQETDFSTWAYCYHAKTGYPTSSSPSVNDCIGLLASLVAVYCVMAFYIGAVFPMGNGAAVKFYFPLLPDYWHGGSRSSKGDDNGDIEAGIIGKELKDGQVGVEAVNVSKSYGKVEALKPFSMQLNVGEVTSLLGHNGAGKHY